MPLTCRQYGSWIQLPEDLYAAFSEQRVFEGFRLVEFVEKKQAGPFYVSAARAEKGADPDRLGGQAITPDDYLDAVLGGYWERRLASPDAELVSGDTQVMLTYHGERYHPLIDGRDFSWCGMDDSIGPDVIRAVVAWRRGMLLCGHCARAIRRMKGVEP